MTSRRHFIAVGLAAGAVALIESPLLAAGSPLRSATAVAQVFGDGQKLIAIALEYPASVEGKALSADHWRVEGRTVTAVFASTSTDPANRVARGRFVIVALSPDDPAALLRAGGRIGGGLPPGSGPVAPGVPSMPMGPPRGISTNYLPARATVLATGPVRVTGGRTYPPTTAPIPTTAFRNLLVDQFRQGSFPDPVTGDVLPYSLFLPKDYDPKKSYPLVLFMHDAGASSKDPQVTLKQGLGAVVWTSPAEQAKRPCIVLAPQWSDMVVNDQSEATSMLDTTVHLVEQVARVHSVDRDRIYSTGQSGGAMMTIAIGIKYPDLFAASFIVAGQWDAKLVAPLASDKLWIMVAEGDVKAFPGQNAITAELEQHGAKVARATWDGRWSATEFAKAVALIEAQNAPINYTVLAKGSVVPPGQNDNPGGNHINTWRIAYTVEGIRDWLFRQHK
jgi:predicted peptidase